MGLALSGIDAATILSVPIASATFDTADIPLSMRLAN